ncbi:hypothetical protein MNBD_GAMMA01-1410, partial [hydrothermal vent metagenome]
PVTLLQNYIYELTQNIELFDIAGLQSTLQQFPQLKQNIGDIKPDSKTILIST